MRGTKIGDEGVFVKRCADAVTEEFTHSAKAEGLKGHLNGVADVADAIARSGLLKALEKGIAGGAEEAPEVF